MRVVSEVVVDIVIVAVIDIIITIMMIVVLEVVNAPIEETGVIVPTEVTNMTILVLDEKLDLTLRVPSISKRKVRSKSQRRLK